MDDLRFTISDGSLQKARRGITIPIFDTGITLVKPGRAREEMSDFEREAKEAERVTTYIPLLEPGNIVCKSGDGGEGGGGGVVVTTAHGGALGQRSSASSGRGTPPLCGAPPPPFSP